MMAIEFSDDVRKCIEDALAAFRELASDSSKIIFGRVIGRTPIDFERRDPRTVGLARANWLISEGERSSVVKRLDEEDGPAPVLSPQGDTYQRVEQYIDAQSLEEDTILTLTNNVPYIRRLEYQAWSNQAPAGMRGITITEFPQIIEQALNTARQRTR